MGINGLDGPASWSPGSCGVGPIAALSAGAGSRGPHSAPWQSIALRERSSCGLGRTLRELAKHTAAAACAAVALPGRQLAQMQTEKVLRLVPSRAPKLDRYPPHDISGVGVSPRRDPRSATC